MKKCFTSQLEQGEYKDLANNAKELKISLAAYGRIILCEELEKRTIFKRFTNRGKVK